MLILKASINHKKIDEVHIQNVGLAIPSEDLWGYRIRKPEGYADKVFYHIRKDGYLQLASDVLYYLANNDKKEKGNDDIGECEG